MAHRYKDVIRVEIDKTAPGEGILHSFTWRGVRYTVAEMLGSWHLADRWWDRERHSDRMYWRVQTPDFQVFELYHDSVSGVWILDVIHD